jgi:hypothetical protein
MLSEKEVTALLHSHMKLTEIRKSNKEEIFIRMTYREIGFLVEIWREGNFFWLDRFVSMAGIEGELNIHEEIISAINPFIESIKTAIENLPTYRIKFLMDEYSWRYEWDKDYEI